MRSLVSPLSPFSPFLPRSLALLLTVAAACGGQPAATDEGAAATESATAGSDATEQGSAPAGGEERLGLAHEQHLPDGLTTGGMPDRAVLEAARDQGITTVISLRTSEEPGATDEGPLVEGLGMTFVSIPIAGAAGLTEANARAVREAVGDDAATTLLHCGSSNRVGAVLALGAFFIDGASKDEALAIGRGAGLLGLEDATAAVIDGD